MLTPLQALFQKKSIRFLLCGVLTAVFNIALIDIIFRLFQLETVFLRNLANLVAVEISLIFTFFIYRAWVWQLKTWQPRQILLAQLPKFHAASGLVIGLRIFVLFPLFDWIGLTPVVNTFIGIGLGAAVNYVMNDKLVFIE